MENFILILLIKLLQRVSHKTKGNNKFQCIESCCCIPKKKESCCCTKTPKDTKYMHVYWSNVSKLCVYEVDCPNSIDFDIEHEWYLIDGRLLSSLFLNSLTYHLKIPRDSAWFSPLGLILKNPFRASMLIIFIDPLEKVISRNSQKK